MSFFQFCVLQLLLPHCESATDGTGVQPRGEDLHWSKRETLIRIGWRMQSHPLRDQEGCKRVTLRDHRWVSVKRKERKPCISKGETGKRSMTHQGFKGL